MRAATPGRQELAHLMGAVVAKDFANPTQEDLAKGRMAMMTMVSVMIEYFLYKNHSPANALDLPSQIRSGSPDNDA